MVGSTSDPHQPGYREVGSSAGAESRTEAGSTTFRPTPLGPAPERRSSRGEALDIERVLVCLDGTELCERALPYARALAETWDAPLTLLHVVEPRRRPGDPTPWDALDWEVARAEGRAYLEDLRARAVDWKLELESRLPEGYAPEQILNETRREGTGLTVLSTRGDLDPSGWELGITTQMVVSRSPGSMLVVPPQAVPAHDGRARLAHIGVALDGSLRSEFVLPAVARLARHHGARITLLHVVPRPEIPFPAYQTEDDRGIAQQLEAFNAQAGEHYLAQLQGRLEGEGLEVTTLLQRQTHVREGLTETAMRQRFDLLVLSAHGQTGSCRSPYGSTTRHLVGAGLVPLLIIQDVPREEREWPGCDNDLPAPPLPNREEMR